MALCVKGTGDKYSQICQLQCLMCVCKSSLFPSFCLRQEDHEEEPWQTCLYSLVAVWPQFYVRFMFFLHPFGVRTFMLTRVSNGALAEAMRVWAVGPGFAVGSTRTTS